MILGIGTDILNVHQLAESSLSPSDPFLKKTYTEREIAEAMTYLDAHSYYATRFAGKEAVFKTFGAHPDSIRLDEIEILGDENGAPKVATISLLLLRSPSWKRETIDHLYKKRRDEHEPD